MQLQVSEPEPGHYLATTSVRQSDHGIKRYTAFLGALKVRDDVDVEIDIDLREPAGPEAQA